MIHRYLFLKNDNAEIILEIRPLCVVFLIKITKPNGEFVSSEIVLSYEKFIRIVQSLNKIARFLR